MGTPYTAAIQRALEFVGNLQQSRSSEAERAKEHADELAFRKEQLDAQKEQAKAQQDAAEKLFNLQHAQMDLQQRQSEFNQALQGAPLGIKPVGSTTLPAVQPTAAQPLVYTGSTGGADLTKDTTIMPSGQSVTIPTPQAITQLEVDRQRQLLAPQIEARLAETRATQEAETARQLQIAARQETARMNEINLQKKWDDDRTTRMINAENSRAQMQEAMQLRMRMAEVTGGLSEMTRSGGFGSGGLSITTGPDGAPQFNLPKEASNIQQGINGLYNGTMSLERLEKTNPKQKQMISNLAGQANVGSLSDNDVKELQDVQKLGQLSDQLYELHKIRQNGVTADWQRFNALKDSFKKDIPGVITGLNNVKRANTAEMQNTLEGLVPSRVPIISRASTEGEKFNAFTNELKQRAENIVQGLPKNQQDAILHTYGVLNLKRLNLNSQPGQKQIIWVRDPKTGQLVQSGAQ